MYYFYLLIQLTFIFARFLLMHVCTLFRKGYRKTNDKNYSFIRRNEKALFTYLVAKNFKNFTIFIMFLGKQSLSLPLLFRLQELYLIHTHRHVRVWREVLVTDVCKYRCELERLVRYVPSAVYC